MQACITPGAGKCRLARYSAIPALIAALTFVDSGKAFSQQTIAGFPFDRDPAVTIGDGASGPDTELYRVVAAIRLSDRRLVIADSRNRIQLFDPQGRHLKRAGGAGAGPGEYVSIGWLQRLDGDTLLVFDRDNARLTYLDAELNTIRVQGFDVHGLNYLGRFSDGTYAAATTRPQPAQQGEIVRRDELHLGRHDGTGTLINGIAVVDGREYLRLPSFPGLIAPTFMRHPHFVVDGNRLLVATNEEFAVDIYTPDGTRTGRHFANSTTSVLSQAEISRLLGDFAARDDLSRWPDGVRFPSIIDVLVADDGSVWVGEFHLDEDRTARFVVFAPDGEILRSVEMPPGFGPTHIGSDFIVGVWRDSLDVEFVQVYE